MRLQNDWNNLSKPIILDFNAVTRLTKKTLKIVAMLQVIKIIRASDNVAIYTVLGQRIPTV